MAFEHNWVFLSTFNFTTCTAERSHELQRFIIKFKDVEFQGDGHGWAGRGMMYLVYRKLTNKLDAKHHVLKPQLIQS